MPLNWPFALFNWNPGGKAPDATAQWYGGCPPLADSDCEYALLTVAAGKAEVRIANREVVVPVPELTARAKSLTELWPVASLTAMPNEKFPDVFVVPPKEPVDLFNWNPDGKLPAVTVHW